MKKYDRLKIPTDHGRYYKDIWLELYDGGSDQWLWVCRDSLAYIFIEVLDMVGYCGKEATSLFDASVSVVDLLTVPPSAVASAFQSCGCEEELDFKVELDRLRIAEMLFSVGTKAPMWNDCGGAVKDQFARPDEKHPAFRILRSNARKYAEENLFNDEERNKLLDTKVVNQIGETAREYMHGTEGMWAAVRRIKEADEAASPKQKLVLRAYQSAGQTLGAGPVPADIMEKT